MTETIQIMQGHDAIGDDFAQAAGNMFGFRSRKNNVNSDRQVEGKAMTRPVDISPLS